MNQLEQSQFEDLKNQVKFLSNLVENLTNNRQTCPIVPAVNYATWKSYKQSLIDNVFKQYFGTKEERFKKYGDQHRSYVIMDNYRKSATNITNTIYKYLYGIDTQKTVDAIINTQESLNVYMEIYDRVVKNIKECEEEFNEPITNI